MRKNKNRVHLEGLLYEHSLEMKVSGPQSKNPGTSYITGTVSVATDSECVNIVPVHFTYVTPNYSKSGAPNPNYATLKNIVDGNYANVMTDGKEKAVKVSIDGSISLNEFYSDRSGKVELVSVKRNEGSFIHVINVLNDNEEERNKFEVDMLITKTIRKEADEERNLPEKLIVKGAIFDFRNTLLPVEFSLLNPAAIDYYDGLEISGSNPYYAPVRGKEVSEMSIRKVVKESAWGEEFVSEVKTSQKDFVATFIDKESYEWDVEGSITIAELNELISNREIYLATLRQRYEDNKISKAAANVKAGTVPAIAKNGDFDF